MSALTPRRVFSPLVQAVLRVPRLMIDRPHLNPGAALARLPEKPTNFIYAPEFRCANKPLPTQTIRNAPSRPSLSLSLYGSSAPGSPADKSDCDEILEINGKAVGQSKLGHDEIVRHIQEVSSSDELVELGD